MRFWASGTSLRNRASSSSGGNMEDVEAGFVALGQFDGQAELDL
jgi:hypothetical protein